MRRDEILLGVLISLECQIAYISDSLFPIPHSPFHRIRKITYKPVTIQAEAVLEDPGSASVPRLRVGRIFITLVLQLGERGVGGCGWFCLFVCLFVRSFVRSSWE